MGGEVYMGVLDDSYSASSIVSGTIHGLTTRGAEDLVEDFIRDVQRQKVAQDPKRIAPLALYYLRRANGEEPVL